MACRLAENARTVFDPTALLIISAEIQPADPRKRNCSGAHRTRLETDVKVAARQPGVADRSGGFPQGDHLRVCRRVFQFLNPVAGTPDDTTGPAVDHDAPDAASCRAIFIKSLPINRDSVITRSPSRSTSRRSSVELARNRRPMKNVVSRSILPVTAP